MNDEALKKKIRRIFTMRVHKFPQKKVQIIQTPETRNQRFIIAPYDQTEKKILRLLNQSKLEMLEQLEKKVITLEDLPKPIRYVSVDAIQAEKDKLQ